MKPANISGGTRQKSYVLPLVKRIFIRPVDSSYPMAEMAEDDTGIMFMASPLQGVGVGERPFYMHWGSHPAIAGSSHV